MNRVIIGFAAGIAVGLLLIAGIGASYGYVNGIPNHTPPGVEAAALDAFVALAFFWWLAVIPGVIGAIAGLGSGLVRARQKRRLFWLTSTGEALSECELGRSHDAIDDLPVFQKHEGRPEFDEE